MEPGIFSKVFLRADLDETLRLIAAHGIRQVQFNLACAGLPSLPPAIPPGLAERIRDSFSRHGVRMVAVSGTFNMAHPDPAVVADGLRRLAVLAAACPQMGARTITLCTGTRHPADMWHWHADNDTPAAWRDLVGALARALEVAGEADVCLAVEPEQANIVHSAALARRLLDHFGSPRLKIVMDPANLFECGEPRQIARIIEDAFDLLGPDIVLAHAKDRDAAGRFVPAGQGVLDYDHYLAQLRRVSYAGAVVLHGLAEDEVATSMRFLRQKMETG